MSAPREFLILTADGARYTVPGRTMRQALRTSGLREKSSAIVAAVDAACLPARPAEADRPFSAIFLANPNFVPPREPQE